MSRLPRLLTLAIALLSTGVLMGTPPCDPEDKPKPDTPPDVYVQNPAPIQRYYDSILGVYPTYTQQNPTTQSLYRYRGTGLTPEMAIAHNQLLTLGVTFDQGQPQVTCDGVTLSADRIEVANQGKVNVLTATGNLLATFETDDNRVVLPPGATFNVSPILATTERRIIGVHLGKVPDAVAYHLEEDAGDCVMITEVMKGYPALAAGLKKFDVITHIENQSPASTEVLRKVLDRRNDGETVRLRIRRGGRTIEVSVPAAVQRTAGSPGSRYYFHGYHQPLNESRSLIYSAPTLRSLPWTFQGPQTGLPAPAKEPQKPATPDPASLQRIEKRLEKVEKLLQKLSKDARI